MCGSSAPAAWSLLAEAVTHSRKRIGITTVHERRSLAQASCSWSLPRDLHIVDKSKCVMTELYQKVEVWWFLVLTCWAEPPRSETSFDVELQRGSGLALISLSQVLTTLHE